MPPKSRTQRPAQNKEPFFYLNPFVLVEQFRYTSFVLRVNRNPASLTAWQSNGAWVLRALFGESIFFIGWTSPEFKRPIDSAEGYMSVMARSFGNAEPRRFERLQPNHFGAAATRPWSPPRDRKVLEASWYHYWQELLDWSMDSSTFLDGTLQTQRSFRRMAEVALSLPLEDLVVVSDQHDMTKWICQVHNRTSTDRVYWLHPKSKFYSKQGKSGIHRRLQGERIMLDPVNSSYESPLQLRARFSRVPEEKLQFGVFPYMVFRFLKGYLDMEEDTDDEMDEFDMQHNLMAAMGVRGMMGEYGFDSDSSDLEDFEGYMGRDPLEDGDDEDNLFIRVTGMYFSRSLSAGFLLPLFDEIWHLSSLESKLSKLLMALFRQDCVLEAQTHLVSTLDQQLALHLMRGEFVDDELHEFTEETERLLRYYTNRPEVTMPPLLQQLQEAGRFQRGVQGPFVRTHNALLLACAKGCEKSCRKLAAFLKIVRGEDFMAVEKRLFEILDALGEGSHRTCVTCLQHALDDMLAMEGKYRHLYLFSELISIYLSPLRSIEYQERSIRASATECVSCDELYIDMKRCSSCKIVTYCGIDCQRDLHISHRFVCKMFQKWNERASGLTDNQNKG